MTLAQQIAAEILAAKAIRAAAKAENRDLTAEELAKLEAHIEKADELKAKAATEQASAEAQADALARLDAHDAELSQARPRRVGASAGQALPPATARENFLDDPMRGFKSHRHFFATVRQVALGDRMPANLKCLLAPQATAGSDEQSGASSPYGEFLVPKVTQAGILTTAIESNPMAGRTKMVPMASPTVAFNARVDKNHTTSVSGGLRAYRRAEAAAVAASRMSFEQIELKADSLMGVAFATEEILRDSPESFTALLDSGFRDEFEAKLIAERLSGTGAGEYMGIAASPCLIDVPKENGQVAATINYANIVKMRARCYGYSNAVWYANQDCLPELLRITAPGSTVPLFTQDAMGVERIFGRPVIFGEFAESVGTVGDLVLGNWGEYLEGEYQPIEGVSSIHVRFVEHEQAFKFTKRCAGAPWWRQAMTPKKGATLSPFVRLASRT